MPEPACFVSGGTFRVDEFYCLAFTLVNGAFAAEPCKMRGFGRTTAGDVNGRQRG
ncbi:MAG: hypothetical protein ACQESR_30320 [Planctomycetota bacterium]